MGLLPTGVHSSATRHGCQRPQSAHRSPPAGWQRCLTPAALHARLEEEIGRAERHGTGLSCLLVAIENLDELAREHGGALREQTLEYVAGALRRELRRFDRIGRPERAASAADRAARRRRPAREIVARRVLERLRTIKVEAEGAREPLDSRWASRRGSRTSARRRCWRALAPRCAASTASTATRPGDAAAPARPDASG